MFNLTSKIQGKIMSEDKGPSINLRNINFINMADRVCPGSKEQRRPREDSAGNVLNEVFGSGAHVFGRRVSPWFVTRDA